MVYSFTRNYEDNSTEAGFQFTFYCDNCQDGYKSTFIQSETYKKGRGLRGITQGLGLLGRLSGSNLGYNIERSGDILSERFEGMSPEWHKEKEKAFEIAKNEAGKHFHKCHSCNSWVCDTCYNDTDGLCTNCAPRQDVAVAKARAAAMQRNIDEVAETATVWSGKLEKKTTVCPNCGKPAGDGKFCNNCGTSMDLASCPSCGAKNPHGIRFCGECGANMTAPVSGKCSGCNFENPPGTKFCGNCGAKIM